MNTRRYHYFHSGVSVRSEIELPEWDRFAEPLRGRADVTIRCAEHGTLSERAIAFPIDGYIASADNLSFHVENVGTWSVSDGAKIDISVQKGADLRAIRLFTLGSAWAALGYQRNWAMWHASSVAWEGGAVLFCGNPGQGKSTLAAYLSQRSHGLVGDDLCRVSAEGQSDAVVFPSSARVKLWDEALQRLQFQDAIVCPDLLRADKFHCTTASVGGVEPAPIRAVIGLAWGEDRRLQPVSGAEAVRSVLAATSYRPQFVDAMGCAAEQAAAVMDIAARVPVFILTRPRAFDQLDQTYALLRAELG